MNVMNFLKRNVYPATGCTEPIAVAYAVSAAYNSLHHPGSLNNLPEDFIENSPNPDYDNLIKVTIETDRDVFKNAWAVGIPGTNGQRGMGIAAAMGLYCNPRKGLNLFRGVEPSIAAQANSILKGGKIYIKKVSDTSSRSEIDIRVDIEYKIDGSVRKSSARIQKKHDAITLLKVDENTLYELSTEKAISQNEQIPNTLSGLVRVARNLTNKEMEEVYKGIVMNKKIAEEGLRGDYGICIGKQLENLVKQHHLGDGMVTQARILAGAAGDDRVAGADIAVMSTAGSGNQGITALIPIIVAAEYNSKETEKVCGAAMLSHLVTKYISNFSGDLSALCGCTIKAGVGAAAGVAYLLGGELNEINDAINNMAANLTGVVCDGAKESCALKLSTAAGTATEAALMALNGVRVPSDNGIVHERAEDTMKCIGAISTSMVGTDLEIVKIMQNK